MPPRSVTNPVSSEITPATDATSPAGSATKPRRDQAGDARDAAADERDQAGGERDEAAARRDEATEQSEARASAGLANDALNVPRWPDGTLPPTGGAPRKIAGQAPPSAHTQKSIATPR
jgi:hypothetical protein